MTDSSQTVRLTIDGRETVVCEGITILEAARQVGIDIPVICQHEATTANGVCRIYVVDVDGGRLLQPACSVFCRDGMVVETRTERVARSRRTILEMLNASVDLSEAPEIQRLMDDYQVDTARFPGAVQRRYPLYDDNPFYVRDYSKCVLCWRCVQMCAADAQYTFALTLANRGFDTRVSTAFEAPLLETVCVYCGQCVGVCPTNALKPKIQHILEQEQAQS